MERMRAVRALSVGSMALLIGCAPASPAAPTAPTLVPTARALATQAAPMASPVASAIAAIPVAPVASAVASAVAASPIVITGAQLSPSDTTLTLRNTSGGTVDLTGYSLRVGTATASLPGALRMAPGETVTIHTASGTSTATDAYLGAASQALLGGLQPGAQVTLVDARGSVVSTFSLPR